MPILNKLKILFALFFIIESSILFSQTNDLENTKWELTKLVLKENNQIIIPTKYYFISFGNNRYQYSLEKNKCGGEYELLEKNKIVFGSSGCTRVCCDGDISDHISYSGVFNFRKTGSSLILFNDKRYYEFRNNHTNTSYNSSTLSTK